MPEGLFREIRKLEVRLEDFLKENEEFVKELRTCLEKLKELNRNLEELGASSSPEKIKMLMKLRLESTKALNEALKKGSRAEHEKSHLSESYGALVLALEEEFQSLNLMTTAVQTHRKLSPKK